MLRRNLAVSVYCINGIVSLETRLKPQVTHKPNYTSAQPQDRGVSSNTSTVSVTRDNTKDIFILGTSIE